jgi:hypothetical protein
VTFCVTQVTFFVTTKTPTSLGGSGFARPPRKALARSRHLPLWPPPLARPHKWASASDQHIFTDARSASLRKRYSGQPTFRVLFPQGHTLGVGPSEGRAPHDRQGKPLAPPRHSASGHRLWPDRTNGPGIRPTHLHGRAERQTIFGPTNIPCAFRKATRSGLAPRTARQIGHLGHRLWPDRTNASASDQHIFTDARSASLRKRYSGQPTFRVLFPQGHTLGVAPPRRVGLRTTAKESPWLHRGIPPLWPPPLAQPHPEDRVLLPGTVGFASESENERPRHSTDTSSRTRGAHPSANSAFGLSRNCPR